MVPLFGALKRNPSNNREGGGVLALDGRRSINTPNNQPTVGGSDRGDVLVEARWAASDGDGVGVSFGASNRTIKKKLIKIRRGLRWPLIDKKTHNNQPKTGGRDGVDYGGEARQVGGVGKRDTIIFGGGEVQREVKN